MIIKRNSNLLGVINEENYRSEYTVQNISILNFFIQHSIYYLF